MVYSGKPSTGCYLCRKRKIKCDEGRPGCRNCRVYGKDCPGYRPICFASSSANGGGSSMGTAGGRRRKSTSVGSCSSSSTSSSSSSTDGRGMVWSVTSNARSDISSLSSLDFTRSMVAVPRPKPLGEAMWEDQALCYFFDQYTVPKNMDGGTAYLESIPELYLRCRENEVGGGSSSCLRWAVDASALTSFAHQTKSTELALQGRKKYGMALRGLHEALASGNDSDRDETVAAIVLLALFEDINGERKGLQSSHLAGFELLIKLHSQGKLDTRYSQCLFNFAYTQLQIQILGLGDMTHADVDTLSSLVDLSDPLQKLMYMSTKIAHFIVKLSKKFLKHAGPGPFNKQELFQTIEEAKTLDSEISGWCHSVPAEWLPRIVYSSTGESVLTYQDVLTGCLWNDYRSVRITLQTALEDLCAKAVSISDESDEAIVDKVTRTKVPPSDVVHDLISDVCKSIPFTMGDIDMLGKSTAENYPNTATGIITGGGPFNASSSSSSNPPRIRAIEGYELLWPLWHTCVSRFSTPRQRSLAKETLHRLGVEFGIKLAFMLAGDGSKLSDET